METTMQEVWTEKRQDTSIEKTAEFVLDILTMGAWACWDGDKIERMKKDLVNKYEDDGVADGLEMDSETNEQKSSNYIRG